MASDDESSERHPLSQPADDQSRQHEASYSVRRESPDIRNFQTEPDDEKSQQRFLSKSANDIDQSRQHGASYSVKHKSPDIRNFPYEPDDEASQEYQVLFQPPYGIDHSYEHEARYSVRHHGQSLKSRQSPSEPNDEECKRFIPSRPADDTDNSHQQEKRYPVRHQPPNKRQFQSESNVEKSHQYLPSPSSDGIDQSRQDEAPLSVEYKFTYSPSEQNDKRRPQYPPLPPAYDSCIDHPHPHEAQYSISQQYTNRPQSPSEPNDKKSQQHVLSQPVYDIDKSRQHVVPFQSRHQSPNSPQFLSEPDDEKCKQYLPSLSDHHTANDQQHDAPYSMRKQYPNSPQTQTEPNNTVVIARTLSETSLDSRPTDYMISAILACLCCCMPLGFCAIIAASHANSAARNGDFEKAKENAKTARMLITASVIFGLIIITFSTYRVLATQSTY